MKKVPPKPPSAVEWSKVTKARPLGPQPASDLIDLILARAAELHAAGITSLAIDGITVTLSPPPRAPPPDAKPPDPTPIPSDPFSDPATFGGRSVGYRLDPE